MREESTEEESFLTVAIRVGTNRGIGRWCVVQYLQVFKTVGGRDAKLRGTCAGNPASVAHLGATRLAIQLLRSLP